MRRAARKDDTHKAVKSALEALDCFVLDLNGAIDFLVHDRQTNRLHAVDAKTHQPYKSWERLTDTQTDLIASGFPLELCYGADDAASMVKRWRQSPASSS